VFSQPKAIPAGFYTRLERSVILGSWVAQSAVHVHNIGQLTVVLSPEGDGEIFR
jgi:hypothetical protein